MKKADKRVQLSPSVFLAFPAPDSVYLEVEENGALIYSELFSRIDKIAQKYHDKIYPECDWCCGGGQINTERGGTWVDCDECDGTGFQS